MTISAPLFNSTLRTLKRRLFMKDNNRIQPGSVLECYFAPNSCAGFGQPGVAEQKAPASK